MGSHEIRDKGRKESFVVVNSFSREEFVVDKEVKTNGISYTYFIFLKFPGFPYVFCSSY